MKQLTSLYFKGRISAAGGSYTVPASTRVFELIMYDNGFVSITPSSKSHDSRGVKDPDSVVPMLQRILGITVTGVDNLLWMLDTVEDNKFYIYLTLNQYTSKFKLTPTNDDSGYTFVIQSKYSISFLWKDSNYNNVRNPAYGPSKVILNSGNQKVMYFLFSDTSRSVSSEQSLQQAAKQFSQQEPDQYTATLIMLYKWYSLLK